jgi:hypothetical protein
VHAAVTLLTHRTREQVFSYNAVLEWIERKSPLAQLVRACVTVFAINDIVSACVDDRLLYVTHMLTRQRHVYALLDFEPMDYDRQPEEQVGQRGRHVEANVYDVWCSF